VEVFLGEGRFVGADAVEVAGARLRFGKCVIATGSRAVVPDVPGLQEVKWYTNETIFSLTELPRRLLVIGGGPIGCELGQAFARLGSAVTIATTGGRLLPREDADVAQIVGTAVGRDGVTVVAEVPPPGQFDAVLVAAGRRPNIDALHVSAAGVEADPKAGVRVDDFLRTTNLRVFAAGDVCAPVYKFTHAADAMARIVIRNALSPTKARLSSLTIPWCTYMSPEVGRVGLSESEAKAAGRTVTAYRVDFPHLDRGATDGAEGFVKVLVATGTDRIVGATVVGPHAGELIGTISLAMTHRIGLTGLANTVFPYPTYTEALRKLGDQFNRTRLTPRTKWALGVWLKWFR
jgi:pyruvate/2-oxoglutarate dehydrogenase complex dihydrolipoamide dehydrogenase (E3) component